MPSSPSIYTMGTVTVTSGSAVVVGSTTGWALNAVTGGTFSLAGVAVPIASVEDDTHLTLGYPWPGATAAGSVYAIGRESALAADATYVHNALVNVYKTLTIAGVNPDGVGTLAERDAITPAPAKDYLWARAEVGYELELYYRSGVGTWLGPFSMRGAPGLGAGGYGLPLGGAVGLGLVKSGSGDGAASWQDIVVSVAGLFGAITAAALKTALGISTYIQTLLAATSHATAQTAIGISTFMQTVLDDTTDTTARATLGAAPIVAPSFTGIARSTGGFTTGPGASNYGPRFTSELTGTGFAAFMFQLRPSVAMDALIQASNTAGTVVSNLTFTYSGGLIVPGALSKGSGTFLIDHPLDPLNRNLRHGFVEAPEYKNTYRGRVRLVAGRATVDVDAAWGLTPGTFAALNADAWVEKLQNQEGFAQTHPTPLDGAVFEIICEDESCTDLISWEVGGRRNDPFVRSDADQNCDADGRFIPEFDKEDA